MFKLLDMLPFGLDICLPFVCLSCEPTRSMLYWLIQTHSPGCPSRHSLPKTRAGTSSKLSIASFLCPCTCHRSHQTWTSSCQEQAESWVPDVSGVFWGFPGWSWVPGSSCWFIHAAIHSPSADWCSSWRWCHKCKQMKICLTSHNLSLMMPFQKECIRPVYAVLRVFGICLPGVEAEAQSHQICR